MKDGPTRILLDSLAIGVVVSTLLLEAMMLLDIFGAREGLRAMGPLMLTVVWAHLAMLAAPIGTLVLLGRDEE
ncbi:hypothetical protein [Jannaschia aquimarina]|uniref:Uncharacterized protein n=1 Tax=Jannaschia aquimarina TaxID=935700 RepID=A0A0D1EJQ8_9RHOB|nr:hypothetical protein [Jannaschia aquimarina]KIT16035.1 hypothetical protein jaqu_23050 [Jannaschia aquimarina]SNT00633.1 hypothetical protein SAMN05421775_104216 [Jannaschia aquimarina]